MLPSNQFQFTDPRDDHEYLYTATASEHGDEVIVTWEWNLMDDMTDSEPRVEYPLELAQKLYRDGMWVLWQEPALG